MTASPQLPPPADLERTCRGLAALDAIVCEDWEERSYSFDAAWAPDRKERMASMRNGSGDDWFIVFGAAGVFVKALWHEYPPEDVAAIYAGLPASLAPHRTEAAFEMERVTFGGWHAAKAWTLRGNAKPMADELAMLTGEPKRYQRYAASYFELELPTSAITHVLAGKPLTAKILAALHSERTLDDLEEDLDGIGYGR